MELVFHLDHLIIETLNGFAQKSLTFDRLMTNVARLDLVKGAVIIALVAYIWLTPEQRLIDGRMVFVRIAAGALVAIVIGRASQLLMPHRPRPIYDPAIDLVLPYGETGRTLADWSSLPSDHAVLYFALATAVWLCNRRLGIFAFAWTAVFVGFARVYTGLHYPSDIVSGALLGSAVMWCAFHAPIPDWVGRLFHRWQESHLASLHIAAFLLAFEMATVFYGLRRIADLGAVFFGATDLPRL